MGKQPKTTYNKKLESIINNKMRLLDDFGICEKCDKDMIEKLKAIVAGKPDKDPQEVLDLYCRVLVLKKMDSWD